MAKVLKCGDINPGCNFEIKADSEHDVLGKAAEHAKRPITWRISRPRFCRK